MVLVLIAAFFLLPIVPYNQNTSLLVQSNITAQVSPSFALFNCGLVWDAVEHYPGNYVTLEMVLWSNGEWVCGGSIGFG